MTLAAKGVAQRELPSMLLLVPTTTLEGRGRTGARSRVEVHLDGFVLGPVIIIVVIFTIMFAGGQLLEGSLPPTQGCCGGRRLLFVIMIGTFRFGGTLFVTRDIY